MTTTVREAPAPLPLQGGLTDPSHPDASNEPVLEIDQIQGNIAPGNPANWVIGGPGDEADVVVIVAADDPDDLADEIARITGSLTGATLIFQQDGATLPDPLRGHEQFGFLDGVSQPGVRGRVSN